MKCKRCNQEITGTLTVKYELDGKDIDGILSCVSNNIKISKDLPFKCTTKLRVSCPCTRKHFYKGPLLSDKDWDTSSTVLSEAGIVSIEDGHANEIGSKTDEFYGYTETVVSGDVSIQEDFDEEEYEDEYEAIKDTTEEEEEKEDGSE